VKTCQAETEQAQGGAAEAAVEDAAAEEEEWAADLLRAQTGSAYVPIAATGKSIDWELRVIP